MTLADMGSCCSGGGVVAIVVAQAVLCWQWLRRSRIGRRGDWRRHRNAISLQLGTGSSSIVWEGSQPFENVTELWTMYDHTCCKLLESLG